MKVRLVIGAVSLLQAGVILSAPLVLSTRADAAVVVKVSVVVRDVDGKPLGRVPWATTSTAEGSTIEDRFTTDALGVGTFDAYDGSVADIRMRLGYGGHTCYYGDAHLRFVGGLLYRQGEGDVPISVDVAAADSDPILITLPALETRTLRVVTRGNRQPVAGVDVLRESSVSTPLPGLDPETRIFPPCVQALTDYSGRARITTYTMEPDPAVARQWGFIPDDDGDGDPEVVQYLWNGFYDHYYAGRGIEYSVWASQSTTTVRLGYVPLVTDASAEPGRRIGTVRVSARVVQGYYPPVRGAHPEPIKGIKAYLVKPNKDSPKRIATATTDQRGRVTFPAVKLRSSRRLVVTIDRTFVPDWFVAKPRR